MQTEENKKDNTWVFSIILVGCIVLGVVLVAIKLTGLI